MPQIDSTPSTPKKILYGSGQQTEYTPKSTPPSTPKKTLYGSGQQTKYTPKSTPPSTPKKILYEPGLQTEYTPKSTPPSYTDGLTTEEVHDPNKIKVTVADASVPIVVLFGPPTCGKTMTLIRLTRYLRSVGYSVEPDRTFRPSTDNNYKKLCDGFDEMVSQIEAQPGTGRINFMLLKVIKNGNTICQILESPGEFFFDPQRPNEPFPFYINEIISNANRKIWALFTEPAHTNEPMDVQKRQLYVNKINRLKSKLSRRDRVVFVYNKIDATSLVQGIGNINYRQAIKDVSNNYPNIFASFKNENPITKLWQPYRFDFVAFQSGDFSITEDGGQSFSIGNDYYPKTLWKFIMRNIRG